MPSGRQRNPEVCGYAFRKEDVVEEHEGIQQVEMTCCEGRNRESLKDQKAPESKCLRPDLNHRVAIGGRLFRWDQATEAPM